MTRTSHPLSFCRLVLSRHTQVSPIIYTFYRFISGRVAPFRSYVAKTTEQLEYALAHADVVGVEMKASYVVGGGIEGKASFDREVERVSAEVS